MPQMRNWNVRKFTIWTAGRRRTSDDRTIVWNTGKASPIWSLARVPSHERPNDNESTTTVTCIPRSKAGKDKAKRKSAKRVVVAVRPALLTSRIPGIFCQRRAIRVAQHGCPALPIDAVMGLVYMIAAIEIKNAST